MATPRPSYIGPFGKRVLAVGGIAYLKYKFEAIPVYNETGASIAADKLVAVGVTYDVTKGLPNVVLADANNSNHTDIYVTLNAIADNTEGYVFKGGKSAATLDTSGATTVGDPIYLSTTAGAFAHTKPTSGNIIPVGWSTVKSATVGQIHWQIGDVEYPRSSVVAGGSALTIDPLLHDGRIVLLDTAAGTTITLPAATGSGLRVKFVVSVKPTSNQHRIDVTGDDAFWGVIVGDTDADSADLATVTWTATQITADTDRIDMNGTTKGGYVGDWLEVVDIATDKWHVTGTITQTGTEASPFTAGAVS